MNESEDTTASSSSTTPTSLPTTREPDNKAPKGSPARLHLLAETVLMGFEMNPDPWYPEFAQWREALLGERPNKQGGTRGFENWNLVSLGMLLAWGYFAGELAEASGGEAMEEVAAAPKAPEPEPAPELRPTFTLLGPDGKPLVEGYK